MSTLGLEVYFIQLSDSNAFLILKYPTSTTPQKMHDSRCGHFNLAHNHSSHKVGHVTGVLSFWTHLLSKIKEYGQLRWKQLRGMSNCPEGGKYLYNVEAL